MATEPPLYRRRRRPPPPRRRSGSGRRTRSSRLGARGRADRAGRSGWLLVSILVGPVPRPDWSSSPSRSRRTRTWRASTRRSASSFVLMITSLRRDPHRLRRGDLPREVRRHQPRPAHRRPALAPAARAPRGRARPGARATLAAAAAEAWRELRLGAHRAVRQPRRRGQHLQPRGRALDHLRAARPGSVRRRSSA